MAKFEELDFAQMERVRARVDELVDDPITAEASSRTTADSANARHSTTNTCRHSTDPTSPSSTPMAGLDPHHRTGIVFDGREYPSIASSMPLDSVRGATTPLGWIEV